ncbi:MAG: ATP-binding cassette domain-containing protein [Candidatus Marinimicrobia bacterium]|nr:ATP-binding cassette domain-containing protein [Candidatus Neomarinimicrobiota bacterium]
MIINYFKYPVVKQHQTSDCGPACLLSLIRYFGGYAYLDKLRLLCHTDYKGCRLYDLKQAAEKTGLKCSAFRIEKGKYPKVELPVILHCELPEHLAHYVIVYAHKKGRFLIGDPAKGLYWLDQKDLDSLWKSRVLMTVQCVSPYRDPDYLSDGEWLLSYVRKYADHVLQILFCGLISIFAGFFTAFLIRTVTERVIPHQDKQLLLISLVFLACFLLIRSAVSYIRNLLFYRHGKILFKDIFQESIAHFTHLPYSIITRFSTGEMTSRFLDIFRIQSFYQFTLLQGLADAFILAGSLLVMVFFSPFLAGLSTLHVLLLAGILTGFYPRLRKLQNTMLQKGAAFSHELIETMEGMPEISAFGVHTYFIGLNREKYDSFLNRWKEVGLLNSRLFVFSECFLGLFQLLFIGWGIVSVLNEQISFGNWLAAFILTANFIPSLFRLMENALKGAEAREAITRIRDLLVHPVEKCDGKSDDPTSDFSLDLRNCTFQWPKYHPLFEKISFSLRKGSLIQISGDNGTGKTTLVHSILRQYQFCEGDMYWNGKPVMMTDVADYRRHFGLVSQDVKIFNMTLWDNISLGRKPEDYRWLNDMHRDFNWFFQKFEYGLLTILGEGHLRLSGGEKQIVGLLRAIFEEPEVLILDECFNSLDHMTRQWVLKWIKVYAGNHAVILISHDTQITDLAHTVVDLKREYVG